MATYSTTDLKKEIAAIPDRRLQFVLTQIMLTIQPSMTETLTNKTLADASLEDDLVGAASQLNNGTAVNSVVATGVLTIDGDVVDGEVVVIGDNTYEWDADSTITEGNIAVDVSGGLGKVSAQGALITAVNAQETDWQLGAFSGDDATLTAQTAGVALNDVATTEDGAGTAWAAVKTSNGVDGTVGLQWDVLVDASYIYVCVADNTIADANWERAAIASY